MVQKTVPITTNTKTREGENEMAEECIHGMNPSWCGSCKQREEARRKGVTTYPSEPPVDPETEIALREIIEEQRRSQHVGNPEEYPLDERFPVDIINMVTKDHETRETSEEEGRTIDQHLKSSVSKRSRPGYAPLEIAYSLKLLAQEGATHAEIAVIRNKSIGWVRKYLSLLTSLAPAVLTMMNPKLPDAKQITFSLALLLIRYPRQLQEQLALEVIQKGISGITAKQFIQERAREEGHEIKKSRAP